MSKTLEAKRPGESRFAAVRRPTVDLGDFRNWLGSLDLTVQPTVHVNGYHFPQAVVTVDFGQPTKPVKLTSMQTEELIGRIRRITQEIVNRDANVRVSYDHAHGVYWASI